MKLKELLGRIHDADVRIELVLDIEEETDYQYTSIWLSDFRNGTSSQYKDWIVDSISFDPCMFDTAQMSIYIRKK